MKRARIGERTAGPPRLRWTLRSVWTAGILLVIAGSLLPGDSFPMRELSRLDFSDKLEHFGAYAGLAFLPALHERPRTLAAMGLCLAALGALLEFAQLLAARDFEFGDMAADAAGICAGLALGWIARRLLR